MRTLAKLGFIVVSTISSIAVAKDAPPQPKAPAADPSAAVKAAAMKMNSAWETGDRKAIENGISDKFFGGAWDYDMAGRPMAWTNKGDVLKMYDQMGAMMKQSGGTMKTEWKSFDCRASGNMGACAGMSAMTMTMPGMPPFTMHMRVTQLFEKNAKGWQATHHHASLARAVELPPKSMALNFKTAKFMEIPGPAMAGISVAPLWMNPFTQQMAGIMKATKDIKQARHFHPYAMTFTVLAGKLVTSDENGKDASYGPGSVVYRAANEAHQTTIKKGTIVFAIADGPVSDVYVDDKGNPLPAAPQP